jgi:hypothetical protein
MIASQGNLVFVKGWGGVRTLTFQTSEAARNWVKGSGLERVRASVLLQEMNVKLH